MILNVKHKRILIIYKFVLFCFQFNHLKLIPLNAKENKNTFLSRYNNIYYINIMNFLIRTYIL